MWNIKLILYIAVMLLFSLYVIVAKPDMHKQAVITDSEYEFVQVETPPAQLKASDSNISLVPQNIEEKPVKVSQVPQPQRKIQTSSVNLKPSQPQQKVVKTPVNKQIDTENKKQQPLSATPVQQKQDVKSEQPVVTPNSKIIKPVLTEQEEIIAWNKWRSNLQNQVMRDSRVSAPLGTQFKFSFTVDKYGNMSNVKVWSPSPAFNDYAVRMIKPVLMSYRNKPILNFPEGTKRVITNVNGGFVISRVTEYSTPSDYNDFERVRR